MLDVLLIEDDPGDELITREALETNTVVSLLQCARDSRRVSTTSSIGVATTRTPRGPT